MKRGERGLTLVELLMAVTILSIIGLAFFSITKGTMESWTRSSEKDEATEKGRAVLERIAQHVLEANRVLVPFQRVALDTSVNHILCLGGFIDTDGDGAIDEDAVDVDGAQYPGLQGLDDDWDGTIDNGVWWQGDDDEDGDWDEDPIDGKDNDSDGWFDEDWPYDMNGDSEPGVILIDDDDDGFIDEGSQSDDDEDGTAGEDQMELVVYYVDPSARPPELVERHPTDGTTVLAENLYYENEADYADGFTVRRVNLADGTTVLELQLRLSTEGEETVDFRTTLIAPNAPGARSVPWSPFEIPVDD